MNDFFKKNVIGIISILLWIASTMYVAGIVRGEIVSNTKAINSILTRVSELNSLSLQTSMMTNLHSEWIRDYRGDVKDIIALRAQMNQITVVLGEIKAELRLHRNSEIYEPLKGDKRGK